MGGTLRGPVLNMVGTYPSKENEELVGCMLEIQGSYLDKICGTWRHESKDDIYSTDSKG